MSVLEEPGGPFANLPDERRRAGLTAARNATDMYELCEWMEMLGLRAYESNVTGTKRQR